MKVILFDEHEDVAKNLGNILKEEYNDVQVCTTLFLFFEAISCNSGWGDSIFVLSENVLNNRNITISYLLKRFDYHAPIITYCVSNIHLSLDVNYIYEYQKNNYKTFRKDIYNIELCFSKFANDKSFFSLNNFSCKEVPTYLSVNKKRHSHHNLYETVATKEESDITFSLTKMQAKLFTFLLSHADGASLGDILYNLWGSEDKSKAQSVYTLVHELNRIILQKTENKYRIIHQGKKYHLLQSTETSLNKKSHNAEPARKLNGCSIIE